MSNSSVKIVQKGAFLRLFVFGRLLPGLPLLLLPFLLLPLLLLPRAVLAACPPSQISPQSPVAEVVYVIDGDTLILADGRHVRLIGINTPEKDSGEVAVRARQQLMAWLAANDNRIRLAYGPEREDHYERTLAYVFSGEQDIGARLLAAGLAWFAVVPPNSAHAACYQMAENRAREAQLGLWQESAITPAKQVSRHRGFILARGVVTQVREPAGHLVLTLDDSLDIFIHRRERKTLQALPADPATLLGRQIEARGWLYDYKGTPNLRIMHPAMLDLSVSEQ